MCKEKTLSHEASQVFFSYCLERFWLPNSHGEGVQTTKKGNNHDQSEEEWVLWAYLAVSGLQHH